MNKKTEIQFIAKQFRSKKCGQTCLSMITGKNVEDICNELGKFLVTNMVTDLQVYLNNNGYKTRIVHGVKIQRNEIPNNSIVRLCFPDGTGHFVVKFKNKFYDPDIGIVKKYLANVRYTDYLTFKK